MQDGSQSTWSQETDLSRPELIAYLDRVSYWERAYGGWLCMFIEEHSTLQPDEEFIALLQQTSAAGSGAGDFKE